MKAATPPFQKAIKTAVIASCVPASVAATATGHAVNETLAQAGFGTWGTTLAVLFALALAATYGAFVHLLMNCVAPLPAEDRAKVRPAIIGGTALVLVGSAYPNVIVTAGHQATLIADRAYITTLAEIGDALKRGARSLGQIETIMLTDGQKLQQTAVTESSGGVSGAQAAGGLTELIRARAQDMKDAHSLLAGPKETVNDQMATFDQALDRMRAALLDKNLSIEARRVLMQRHGDEARSAAIAIAAVTPTTSLQALADKMMGAQLEPVWSARSEIRKQQEEGFAKVKDELKRMGRALGRNAAELSAQLKMQVPVYSPDPASILVLRYAWALSHIWALAAALDLLPVVLFVVACGLYDAQRRRASLDLLATEIATSTVPATPLGAHPYPASTRARIEQAPPTKPNGLLPQDAS